MRFIKQNTLKNDVNFEGVGLHSGEMVNMTLSPAPFDTGIVFRRVDLQPVAALKLSVDNMQESLLCSKLVYGDLSISTIEHLLSALCAFQVDNVFIDLDAPEVPVFDGSSRVYVQAFSSVGVLTQTQDRQYLKIINPITVKQDDQWVKLLPNSSEHDNSFNFNLSIDFEHPVIKKTPQQVHFTLSKSGFVNKVASARTFGFVKDLEKLHANNLALGGSLDNAVGLSESEILNEEKLRYEDEFVRHKLLDAIGDLYVSGPIIGSYEAYKPSHALNHRCLKKLLEDTSAYEVIKLSK